MNETMKVMYKITLQRIEYSTQVTAWLTALTRDSLYALFTLFRDLESLLTIRHVNVNS